MALKMKYIIASGWWSCEPEMDMRNTLLGDNEIRDVAFHGLWRDSIDYFTNAEEIIVVDSASPRKPENTKGETWLSMRTNFGHSTNHQGKYSGYTRSILISLMYAFSNDYDYWVFVEQDALLFGEDIIEKTIQASKKNVMYGSGKGTPQPIQQSFMIIKKEAIPSFIYNMDRIKPSDSVISPEWKFLFAVNKLAKFLPDSLLIWISSSSQNRYSRYIKNKVRSLVRVFDDFESMSLGYGRARPIDFSQNEFYFQHGDKAELEKYLTKLNTIISNKKNLN